VDFKNEEQDAKEIQESIKIALEATHKDLEDVFEEETQKNLPPSVGDLASDDFPCFLTVKKLIYMLDASLTYPFFSRGVDGRIYGMDSSTEWHNENKQGTFMINQYYKDAYDYSKKLKKLGKTIVQVEDIDDDEKLLRLKEEGIDIEIGDIAKKDAIDSDSDSDAENYDNSNIYENYKYVMSQSNYYIGKMKIEDQTFAQEVDYEMFEQKFWGKNKGRIKLSAMNVWTEIFSVIKGGLQTDWFAYIRRGNYSVMSKRNYMKLKSSMDYLSDKERLQIYWLYIKYESWKNWHNLYDFMDVVKHVFCNFPMHFKTKVDYLVVDEVQDLTPLTIQLLVSVTNKNVFFCGDTAQTIAKGVGFRFYDLKDIFDNKKVSIPSVIQLTKNYRSHSKILDLANSIVDVIE
jgi:superfamily I DNA/RNA helicase